jgi:hypothetical protein
MEKMVYEELKALEQSIEREIGVHINANYILDRDNIIEDAAVFLIFKKSEEPYNNNPTVYTVAYCDNILYAESVKTKFYDVVKRLNLNPALCFFAAPFKIERMC